MTVALSGKEASGNPLDLDADRPLVHPDQARAQRPLEPFACAVRNEFLLFSFIAISYGHIQSPPLAVHDVEMLQIREHLLPGRREPLKPCRDCRNLLTQRCDALLGPLQHAKKPVSVRKGLLLAGAHKTAIARVHGFPLPERADEQVSGRSISMRCPDGA